MGTFTCWMLQHFPPLPFCRCYMREQTFLPLWSGYRKTTCCLTLSIFKSFSPVLCTIFSLYQKECIWGSVLCSIKILGACLLVWLQGWILRSFTCRSELFQSSSGLDQWDCTVSAALIRLLQLGHGCENLTQLRRTAKHPMPGWEERELA